MQRERAAYGCLLAGVMNESARGWEGEIQMLAAIQSIDTIYYLYVSCGHRYLFLVTRKHCTLADL